MSPALTIFLLIHTTTFHDVGNGIMVEVQSVKAVKQMSEAHCIQSIAMLNTKPPEFGKRVLRICTDKKPDWWQG